MGRKDFLQPLFHGRSPSAIAYNRHFGNELNLYEGSLYEVSLTPDKDSEGKVQWKDVRLN